MTNEELATRGIYDKEAMYRLYKHNIGLIVRICRCFASRQYDLQDLLQEAYFPLVTAVEAFNRHGKYKFTTYLTKALKWYFIRFISENKCEVCTLDNPLKGDDGATHADILPYET